MINQRAGALKVEVMTAKQVNKWLQDNPLKTVVDIKFASDEYDDMAMVITSDGF
ncbi:hypothetical protein [Alkalicoccus luteus]|uniref:Uncharacterized protein n=1 Tax=Alkalicoccus luteus TaxID=1237094 RepID=A0A969TUK5_9BACI|nr:hypothetical protein [Alkalicoccus luteus]NJP37162.1 hypothetical protein [Alkalicoccus luteus]